MSHLLVHGAMLDETAWTQIRFSLRRSRVRVSILLALLRLQHAYLADLCREASTTPSRALGALLGDEENYKISDSLVGLGLVVAERGPGETRFRLTPAGAHVAAAYQRETLAELSRERRART